MKLYSDYKKQFNIFFLFSFGILLISFFISPITFSSAQTVDDLNNKINQRNADIAALEKEIQSYQGQLDNLGKQKTSLNGSIQTLDITRKKLIANISLTQNKIDKTNLKIESLSGEIGAKQSSIFNNTEAIVLDIQKNQRI